ncbi:hypothetical protein MBGDC06_00124 [Thermoplasmatales archaeon SCGC AB-539-C06]|nr:hypothetical protein MBGDC06_00124 [Thermoplasmatales archaeon SCGC AB-539-C06]
MLSDIEVEEIKKLINQGKSDYEIGKELGHLLIPLKKLEKNIRNRK